MPTFGTLPGRATLGRRPRRRLRVVLRRQPVVYWAVALVAAGTTWWSAEAALDRVAAGADAYGELVQVVVASRDIDPGHRLSDGDVSVVVAPRQLVPAGVVDAPPVGAVARERLVAGEAIVSSRLAPEGAVGVAATLALDERAVAIRTDDHRPPLRPGQRVDVLATTDPTTAGRNGPTTTVAAGVRVLTVEDEGITVAVTRADSLHVATALATSIVTVVVTPE